jgi:catechol 2,3-dioxygenase-like lactoylglutathione lyase family enzyme
MNIKLSTVVLDAQDAQALSAFYSKLLGWPPTITEPDWVLLRDPKGGTGLSFQSEPLYVPPTWPETPEDPQKMLHLDFLVDHLGDAVAHAKACGATSAAEQFLQDVHVMFDPAGHPFCLFVDPS